MGLLYNGKSVNSRATKKRLGSAEWAEGTAPVTHSTTSPLGGMDAWRKYKRETSPLYYGTQMNQLLKDKKNIVSGILSNDDDMNTLSGKSPIPFTEYQTVTGVDGQVTKIPVYPTGEFEKYMGTQGKAVLPKKSNRWEKVKNRKPIQF